MKRREFINSLGTLPLSCNIGYFSPVLAAPVVSPNSFLASPLLFDRETLEFIENSLPKAPVSRFKALPLQQSEFSSAEHVFKFLNTSGQDFVLTKMHLWPKVSEKMLALFETLKFFPRSELQKFLFSKESSGLRDEVYASMNLVSVPVAFTDSTMARISRYPASVLEEKMKAGNKITIGTTGPYARFSENIVCRPITWEKFKTMTSFEDIDIFDAESVSNNLHTQLVKLENACLLMDESAVNPNYLELVTTTEKWNSMPKEMHRGVQELAESLRDGIHEIAARQNAARIERSRAKGLVVEKISGTLSNFLKRISNGVG